MDPRGFLVSCWLDEEDSDAAKWNGGYRKRKNWGGGTKNMVCGNLRLV